MDVLVDGVVEERNKGLKGAVVTLFENSVQVDNFVTLGTGNFQFTLLLNNDYVIVAGRPGYVTKKISISTSNIPQERLKKTFVPTVKFGIVLFEKIEGLDVSILDKPVAKWVYDQREDIFVHDEEYAKSIQDETTRFLREFEQKKREIYNTIINKADSAFNAEDYQNAKKYYLEALYMQPDPNAQPNRYVNDRITEIYEIRRAKTEAEHKANEEKYYSAIAKADSTFIAGDYQNSKNAYLEALSVKPSKKHIIERIKEIDKVLDAEKEAKYNENVARADRALDAKDYQNAKSAFLEAQMIKPDAKYPKEKLTEVDKIQTALKEVKYNITVAKADSAFNREDYLNAKESYRKAINIKPDESYSKEQIKEIYQILVTIAEAEANLRAKKEEYKAAIAKADKEFNMKNYQRAKRMYEEGLTIMSDQNYPQNKIVAINKILETMEAEVEVKLKGKAEIIPVSEEEKYNAAITKADEALREKNYQLAKMMYQSALSFKPDDKYHQDKIKEIELMLAAIKTDGEIKTRELNVKAKANAIAIAKEESKKQTTESRIKAEEAKKVKRATEDLLAEEERKKLHLYELAQKYPQGYRDTIIEENRKIIWVIVVENDKANEYKKITYNWGGVYYEKNNDDIEKHIFETETKKKYK